MSLALLRQTLSSTLTLTQTELDALYPPALQIAPPRRRYPPQGLPLAAWHEGHFNNSFVTPTPPSQARLLAPCSLLPAYRLLAADYSVKAYFPQAGVLAASTLLPPPLAIATTTTCFSLLTTGQRLPARLLQCGQLHRPQRGCATRRAQRLAAHRPHARGPCGGPRLAARRDGLVSQDVESVESAVLVTARCPGLASRLLALQAPGRAMP